MKLSSVIDPDTDIGFLHWDGLPFDQLSLGSACLKVASEHASDIQLRASVLWLAGGEVQSACGVNLCTGRFDGYPVRCGCLFLVGGLVRPPYRQNRLGREVCEIGVSLYQLERKFVGTTGLPTGANNLEERVEKGLPLAEAALACRFGSYTTLVPQYKQRFVRTPACEHPQISALRTEL